MRTTTPIRIAVVLSLLLVTCAVSIAPAGATSAMGPETPRLEHTSPYWEVAYWNNMSLEGDPVCTSAEASLHHDWGTGSPHDGVSVDHFSVRWWRYLELPSGAYRVTATSDDGIRVTVDDNLIIDQWFDHSVQTVSADIWLAAGHHLVRVEYYENAGLAQASVDWEPLDRPPDAWRGDYFDNPWLRSPSVLQRYDDDLSFDWEYGSPDGLPNDGFSVRWRRTVRLGSGTYLFKAEADDGIRVFVDGQPVIDDGWYDHPAQVFSGEISLMEGDHDIVVEYYENSGLALARVTWESMSAPSEGWRSEYYANNLLHGSPVLVRYDRNVGFNWGYGSPDPSVPSDRFSVRWTRTVNFPPGLYRFTTTTDDGVRLWVNRHLLINEWSDQPRTSHSGSIYLQGDVPLTMEYYERTDLASAWLSWVRVDDNLPPIPALAERVQFAQGATQATVSGYLPAGQSKEYVLRIAAGQYVAMDATIGPSGPGMRFSVIGADGALVKPMGQAHLRTVVPSTQDYYVRLASDIGPISYQMSVLIPVRIRFEPGSIGSRIDGAQAAGDTRHYVLRALGGQQMSLTTQTARGQVGLTISGVDGQVLSSGRVQHSGDLYEMVLPTTQDYLIAVRAQGSSDAVYTMDIVIPPL